MPTLQDRLDRLVAFPATTFPVLSLYLNAEPDEHGKDDVERFIRRELPARGRTFPPRSSERESYDRDIERIQAWVAEELRPSANRVAIFACAGADDFFEAVQLEAPVREHRLYEIGAAERERRPGAGGSSSVLIARTAGGADDSHETRRRSPRVR